MTKRLKLPKSRFLYAVGRPWKNEPDAPIAFYSYGGEIHKGTLSDAVAFRDYCEEQSLMNGSHKEGFLPYKIFRVVEIPESEALSRMNKFEDLKEINED